MTHPHDPSQPPGGGWSPPPGQGGWSAPQQHAPSQGWSPPAQPMQGAGWSAPAAAVNPRAEWQPRSPSQRGAIDFYLFPPKELVGTPRLAYHALTVLSLPLLLPSLVWYGMLFLRFRRFGANTIVAIFTHVFGSIVPYAFFFWVGELLSLPGPWVGIPMTVLCWVPLVARYLLPRVFVASP